MKKKLLLASLLVCATTAVHADDSFQWHGYYRAGLGMDKDFANVTTNGDEVNSLGRFGLEYDDFLAGVLSKRWSDDKGQWAQYNFAFNVFDYEDEYTNPESVTNNPGYPYAPGSEKYNYSSVNTLNASDIYVEMGGLNFLPKDSSIWVGKRRTANGIDLLDLDYRKINGHGFGYSSKTFDVALYKELNAGDMGEDADVVAIDGTLKLKGIKVEGTITKSTTDTSSSYFGNKEGDMSTSILAEYQHNKFMGVLLGSTTYRAQFGKGVTSDKLNMTVITDEKDSSTRFTVDGTTMTKAWTINTIINMESSKVDSANITYSTLTVGARGTNKLTDNISMVYEASIANKKNIDLGGNVATANDGTVYKIAAGPTIQLNTMPWVRPVLRFNAAIIGGDKEVNGLTDKDGKKIDSEVRLGAQFETYF